MAKIVWHGGGDVVSVSGGESGKTAAHRRTASLPRAYLCAIACRHRKIIMVMTTSASRKRGNNGIVARRNLSVFVWRNGESIAGGGIMRIVAWRIWQAREKKNNIAQRRKAAT